MLFTGAIHFYPSQHKWGAKLLGYDFSINYKVGSLVLAHQKLRNPCPLLLHLFAFAIAKVKTISPTS